MKRNVFTSMSPSSNSTGPHESKEPNYTVSFAPNGEIVVAYPHCVQIYRLDPKSDQLVLAASKLFGNSVRILSVSCLANSKSGQYSVAVSLVDALTLRISVEVHLVGPNQESTPSLELNVPRNFSGSSFCEAKSGRGVVAVGFSDGSILLHSKATGETVRSFNSCFSGGRCLFDLKDRWLVYASEAELDYKMAPVVLPSSGPMLKKLAKLLLVLAIDGVLKLSEWRQGAEESPEKHEKCPRKIILHVYDVVTKAHITSFLPVGRGLAHLLLLPFDSHVATVNHRGDNVYIWDLSKLTEVSLLAKYTRGRTPGEIQDFVWSPSDGYIGLVTRASGSVHWFGTASDAGGWVLSNIGSCGISVVKQGDKKRVLAAIPGAVLSISSSGEVLGRYLIPESVSQEQSAVSYDFEVCEQRKPQNPMSHIELDTAEPYTPIHKARKVQFATYNFQRLEGRTRNILNEKEGFYVTTEELDVLGGYQGELYEGDDWGRFSRNYSQFGRGFTVDVYHYSRGSGIPVFFKEDNNEESDEDILGVDEIENHGVESLKSAMESLLID